MILPDNECPEFFIPYLAIVDENLLKELENQLQTYVDYLKQIPEEKHLFRYTPEKWTVKEVIGHNTDTERVKFSAAFRIARGETSPIPGFDEDQYVQATNFNERSIDELIEEFRITRLNTITFFKSLSAQELKRIGTASNKQISARALYYFLVGHVRHHETLLKERYLV